MISNEILLGNNCAEESEAKKLVQSNLDMCHGLPNLRLWLMQSHLTDSIASGVMVTLSRTMTNCWL